MHFEAASLRIETALLMFAKYPRFTNILVNGADTQSIKVSIIKVK